MNNSTISVVIPAYNRADLLPRTIESVAKQTFLPHEVIIIDDKSPDNTCEICKNLKKKYENRLKIIYFQHEENKGEGGARNTGIKLATGEYIAFLDSDDEWMPEKLERQMAFIKKTGADGIFCETFLIENDDYRNSIHVRIDHDKIVPEHLLTKGCGYGTGTNLLISRSAIADDFFNESMRLFIDLDWLFRISQRLDIRIMHEALTYYHKAPMRSGNYIDAQVKIFMSKYEPLLKKWTLLKKLQVHSCMNWYIAHGYEGNGQFFKATCYFILGIFQNPVRNPKQYFFPLKCLARIIKK